jgi:hypothetical protein
MISGADHRSNGARSSNKPNPLIFHTGAVPSVRRTRHSAHLHLLSEVLWDLQAARLVDDYPGEQPTFEPEFS